MKAFCIIVATIISFVVCSTEVIEPPHGFLALLKATTGNQSKYCTAFLITDTHIIASADCCAFFDMNQEHHVKYDICYHPERCVTEINDEDCRTLDYLYKPVEGDANQLPEQEELSVFKGVIIEDICLFELSYNNRFKLREDTILPTIDPDAKVEYLEEMQGLVISCNGSKVIHDIYAIQPHPQSPTTSELDVFYANSTNENENQELKDAFVTNGAALCIIGTRNNMYLMGIIGRYNENPQEFTFIPTCFEEVSETDPKTQPMVDLEKVRNKRGVIISTKTEETSKLKKERQLREKIKNSGFMKNCQQMFGQLFSSML